MYPTYRVTLQGFRILQTQCTCTLRTAVTTNTDFPNSNNQLVFTMGPDRITWRLTIRYHQDYTCWSIGTATHQYYSNLSPLSVSITTAELRLASCFVTPVLAAHTLEFTTGQLNPDTDITLRWLRLRGPLALVTTLFEKERCRPIPTWTRAGYQRDQAWAGLPPFHFLLAGYSNKPIQALSSRGRSRRKHVYTFQFCTRN